MKNYGPKNQDTRSHHTSPTPGNVQKPVTPVPVKVPVRSTGTFKLPEPVTKHPNPVGRPRSPRGG
jgi:hypothetical protein